MNYFHARTRFRFKPVSLAGCVMALLGIAVSGAGGAAGQNSLTFSMDATNGLVNEQVLVPVRATGFNNISSFQFSIHWNPALAVYVGVEQFGFSGLSAGNFGTPFIGNGTLTALWWNGDPGVAGVSLPDGTILFAVRLNLVGPYGSTNSVTMDGNPTQMEVANGLSEILTNIVVVPGQVVIDYPNTPPVLSSVPNKTINENSVLSFTATATDTDLPVNTLTFRISAGAPAGASIHSTSGVFTWTPTEAQGPSTNMVTIQVTDNGRPALSDAKTFAIIVNEVNQSPVLSALGDQTVNEGSVLTFTASATDGDQPANALTFTLDAGAHFGASIHPTTGVFTWTPAEAQGPSTNTVTVRVTDNGSPALSDARTITLVVTEVNQAPVLGAIANQTIAEGNQSTFTATTTDGDQPVNTLTYTLGAGAPEGASLHPTTGVFTWTPTEMQGPSTNTVTVRVTDNGSPVLSDTRTITIVVTEVNQAPMLGSIANQTVNEGSLLSFTAAAADADQPGNTLTYSLDAGAPAGASIHSTTGLFTWTPTEAQGPSTNSVSIRVRDNGTPALSDVRTITVVVDEVNQAPVLGLLTHQTVSEGSLLTFVATATDPDQPSNTLTFSLDAGAPAGASLHPTTGVFTWTPTEAQAPSTNSVTIRVTDNGTPARSAASTISVIVTEMNQAPVLGAMGNRVVNEGNVLTFAATAVDMDEPANTLTYSLDAGAPAGASINPTTGVFTWTPTEAQGPSTNSVTIRVTDNGLPALSDARTIVIIVNEINQAPVLSAIANQAVNEGGLFTFTAMGVDADQPANLLTYTLDAGAPAGASIHPVTGVFTWTPTEGQGPSTNSVTIRVTDNGMAALSDARTISIVVNEVNQAPGMGSLANQTVNEGSLLTFTATATDGDQPANTLTYTLGAGAPAGASLHPGTGVFTWTPTEAQGPSTNTITIRVTDNGTPALSDAKTISIVVHEVNQAPLLGAIANQTMNEGDLLTFTVAATDADQPANTLTYTLEAGAPAGAILHPVTGVLTWTPTEAQGPGTNSVTIRVTDNGAPARSDSRTITIVVNEVNQAPVVGPMSDHVVNEGGLLTFTATATDADQPANTWTYTLDAGAPAGASIHPTTGVFTWTPTETQGPKTNIVTIRATDNGMPSLSGARTITIIVNEVNQAPVLGAIPHQTATEGGLLTFTATATDTDLPANMLTYTLDAGAPAGANIHPTTGVFTWTPAEPQGPSTNFITVRVSDNGTPALSVAKTISVIVKEVNEPPVLASIGNKTVEVGSLLTFTVVAMDSDLPKQVMTYSLDAGAPAGASIHPASGVFTWTPAAGQGPATHMVTIRSTENGVLAWSVSETIAIVVTSNTPMALVIRMNEHGGVTLTWPTQPGRTYKIQYKGEVHSDTWLDLDSPRSAIGSTLSLDDNRLPLANRFYRVVELR